MNTSKPLKWRKWLGRVSILLVVGFLCLNAMAYRHAYKMMHFVSGGSRTASPEDLSLGEKIEVLFLGISIPRPQASAAPDVLGAQARAFQIPGDQNIKLGAWYCPATPNGPLVILFHGYASEKSAMLLEAKAFLELGYSVLLVDFRGSGDSSESDTTIGYYEANDVAAAVRYAQQKLSPSRIILYGNSMGAVAVLRAVHSCGVKPDAIIAEAVFDTLMNTVRHRFEAMHTPSFPFANLLVFWGGLQGGFNGFHHNPVDYARSVTCPILFLHGAADPRAHIEEARRVFDAVPGPKQFKEFPDLGHAAVYTRFPVEWKEVVGGFLKNSRG